MNNEVCKRKLMEDVKMMHFMQFSYFRKTLQFPYQVFVHYTLINQFLSSCISVILISQMIDVWNAETLCQIRKIT